MNKSKQFVAALFISLIAGCTPPALWVPTTGTFTSSKIGITCKTPPGWYQIAPPKIVILTRNGASLESICLQSYRWDDTLWTKKKQFRKDLLLHEMVWLYLTNYTACNAAYKLRVLSSSIISIDSIASARVEFTFNVSDELPVHGIVTCTPLRARILFTEFLAAERNYFDKSLQVYNALISNIKIDSKERKFAKADISGKKEVFKSD